MITLSDSAIEQLTAYFAGNAVQPMRITVMPAGRCPNPVFNIVINEMKPTDVEIDAQGFKFIMDATLYEEAAPLHVDIAEDRVIIQSDYPLPHNGCPGCGKPDAHCTYRG
ncbi:MAG: hypothetical protein ACNI27_08965 [Desulfovibrio sp.]